MRPEELAHAIANAINGSGSTKAEAYGVSYYARPSRDDSTLAWLFVETIQDNRRITYKVEISGVSNAPR